MEIEIVKTEMIAKKKVEITVEAQGRLIVDVSIVRSV